MNLNFILKITAFTIIILFTSCRHAKQNVDILKIGIEPIKPPFSYIKNNKLEGFTVDLNELIGKELSMKIEFYQMHWSPLLPALQNKIIDMIAHVGITEERKKIFDFSIPYYKNEITVVFRKQNAINNKEELKTNRIVGILGSSEIEEWLRKNVKNQKIILVDDVSLAIQALKSKCADGFLVFRQEAKFCCKNNPELDYFVIPNEITEVAFVTRKNSLLSPKINQIINELEKNGEIQRLKDKWFLD